MPNFVKRSSLPLWIALLAILFSALAPSISHAMAAARGGNAVYAEICGVDGLKLVALDGSGAGNVDTQQTPAGEPLQLHMKHCLYCATHGGSFGLPPSPPVVFVLPVVPDLHPSLFYHAPAPLFAWSAAHPRGPPAA